MASISVLSFYVKKGRHADALRVVANYQKVTSSSVSIDGDKNKVLGYVLHVSKGKKMSVTTVKTGNYEKRLKHEVIYHRLVFCR